MTEEQINKLSPKAKAAHLVLKGIVDQVKSDMKEKKIKELKFILESRAEAIKSLEGRKKDTRNGN